jgi:pyruvate dehydrogenase E2 component (dihydrolipoamide acetyltransferase)
MSAMEVKVPDIGDFKEVEVIELMVKVGDTIKVDQSLITVESDKASMEIPSSHAGVVKEIKVKLGDKVAEGSLLLVAWKLRQALQLLHRQLLPAPLPAQPAAPAPGSSCTGTAPVAAPAPAAPAAPVATAAPGKACQRKFARELGVDLSRVAGSGPKAVSRRKTCKTSSKASWLAAPLLLRFLLRRKMAAASALMYCRGHRWIQQIWRDDLSPLSRIKKLSGPNLHRNWVMIPHVTHLTKLTSPASKISVNRRTKRWQIRRQADYAGFRD